MTAFFKIYFVLFYIVMKIRRLVFNVCERFYLEIKVFFSPLERILHTLLSETSKQIAF